MSLDIKCVLVEQNALRNVFVAIKNVLQSFVIVMAALLKIFVRLVAFVFKIVLGNVYALYAKVYVRLVIVTDVILIAMTARV